MTLGDAGIVIDGEEGPKGEAGTPGRFGYDGLPGKFVEIRKKNIRIERRFPNGEKSY